MPRRRNASDDIAGAVDDATGASGAAAAATSSSSPPATGPVSDPEGRPLLSPEQEAARDRATWQVLGLVAAVLTIIKLI